MQVRCLREGRAIGVTRLASFWLDAGIETAQRLRQKVPSRSQSRTKEWLMRKVKCKGKGIWIEEPPVRKNG